MSAAIPTRLPHGPEFRFLDSVSALVPGTSGVGHMEVRGDEDYLRGHFPGRPLVPGVLVTEALAQMCGVVLWTGDDDGPTRAGMLAAVDVRLRSSVTPPATIDLVVEVERLMGTLGQCRVVARHGEVVVADGTLVMAEAPGPAGETS